jgi:hypothetical protein
MLGRYIVTDLLQNINFFGRICLLLASGSIKFLSFYEKENGLATSTKIFLEKNDFKFDRF